MWQCTFLNFWHNRIIFQTLTFHCISELNPSQVVLFDCVSSVHLNNWSLFLYHIWNRMFHTTAHCTSALHLFENPAFHCIGAVHFWNLIFIRNISYYFLIFLRWFTIISLNVFLFCFYNFNGQECQKILEDDNLWYISSWKW